MSRYRSKENEKKPIDKRVVNYFGTLNEPAPISNKKQKKLLGINIEWIKDRVLRIQEKHFKGNQIIIGLEKTETVEELILDSITKPYMIESIAKGLRKNTSVKWIRFSMLQLTQKNLLAPLFNLQRIKFNYKMSSTYFTSYDDEAVPHIHSLAIQSSSEYDDESKMHFILDQCCRLQKLEYLRIDRLMDWKDQQDVSKLSLLTNLQSLRICIKDTYSEALCNTMRSLTQLISLQIHKSKLKDKEFAEAIENISGLKILKLKDCQFIDGSALTMKVILNCNSLESLSIGCIKIPEGLTRDKPMKLKSLEVSSYNFKISKLFQPTEDLTIDMKQVIDTRLNMVLSDASTWEGVAGVNIKWLKIRNWHPMENNLLPMMEKNTKITKLTVLSCQTKDATPLWDYLGSNRSLKTFEILDRHSNSNPDAVNRAVKNNQKIQSIKCNGAVWSMYGDWKFYVDFRDIVASHASLSEAFFIYARSQFGKDDVEGILNRNLYFTFVNLLDSKYVKLCQRNKSNQIRRVGEFQAKIAYLSRSKHAKVLPIEIWELILNYVETPFGFEGECFDYFKKYLKQ